MSDLHPELNVLVLSDNGDRIGTMKVKQAWELAREQGLDLVVISHQSQQTVCKIMDEGKWRYQQSKKQKSQHKKAPPLKEIKFGVSTAQRDIDIKAKRIHEFIEKGCTVKVAIEMKGRERSHSLLAKSKLEAIILGLGDSIRPGDVKITPNCVYVNVQPARTRHVEGIEESNGQSAAGREVHH